MSGEEVVIGFSAVLDEVMGPELKNWWEECVGV
jgi:hypothetical protein